MKARGFEEFTQEEVNRAASQSVDFVIAWMRHIGISAGPTAHYDLYRAIQDAIRAEWERAQEKEKYFARERRQGFRD